MAADHVFSTCCDPVAVNAPQTIVVAPSDSKDLDDGAYRGTITFSSTVPFTVTPSNGSNQYTFKAGDIPSGKQEGKEFTVTFLAASPNAKLTISGTGLRPFESPTFAVGATAAPPLADSGSFAQSESFLGAALLCLGLLFRFVSYRPRGKHF